MKYPAHSILSHAELDRLIDFAYSAEPRRRAERARIAHFVQRGRVRKTASAAQDAQPSPTCA